jgi:hypothetical protein
MASDRVDTAEAVALLAGGRQSGASTNPFRRPDLVEQVGRRVAEVVSSAGIDVVATWDDIEDAVLGHVVSRELGARNLIVYAPQEGVVEFDAPLGAGQRVLLLSVGFDRTNSVRAPVALIRSRGAELLRIVSLRPSAVVERELEDRSKYHAIHSG